MTHLYDSYDREYLTELMGYFPVPSPVSLDGAFEQIQDFCNNQFRAEEIAEALRGTSEDDFYKFFQMIPLELHSQLFENILSNAGKYRNGNDPNNGEVFFGPPANTYAGADPVAIESKVKKCLSTLILFPTDPVRIAATFYQRFVKIHPFYDGNGRVARFIVEVYLIYHHYRVSFEQSKKHRWLHQLNYCHRKTDYPPSYSHSLHWWIHYFRKFVMHESELTGK